MPKILKHMLRIYIPKAEEKRRTLFWVLHKIIEMICFSAAVKCPLIVQHRLLCCACAALFLKLG